MKNAPDLTPIFNELKALLKKHSKGLEVRDYLENSTAKEKKPMYGLLGKNEVVILNRKPQQTYVVGVIMQKHFVGFYSMPLYSHPNDVVIHDPTLAKMKKGKSCINVTALTLSAKRDLERIIKVSIATYKKVGWI